MRVVIADSDKNFRYKLKDILRCLGYMVTGESEEGKSALQIIFQTEPDVVILEHGLPGSEGMDIAEIIGEHRVAPVVLTVGISQNIDELVKKTGVYGLLVKPLQEVSVLPVLEIATANFERVVKLQREIKELRSKLENRKIVEKAKGLLMEEKGLNERQAYRYMQRLSMNKCMPMAKVAKQVIISLKK